MKWKPVDVITGIILLGSIVLIAIGRDGVIASIFFVGSASYLGWDFKSRRKP